ncbi:HAD family hydrolase [Photobacterium lutimaris]|uniref:HAD family phosphatase n=1 Tax=Photobacterium lutimaris TaxID=388278 RepID=A0A2T3J2S5_9GAMM|nr:HAD family phosphatase [Photobacterium lutimaris]PSU35602.1 HAD family phosphatase [Photobacterium lutimaris]TDR78654.1 HAD superfamily hydrolase (TIGR01509 family) [Photobacterium lutimaris]
MNEVKAVLFDMDGLIFDTEGLYKACWQYAAEEQGLVLTDEDYQSFIGVQDVECERRITVKFGEALDLERFCQVRDNMFNAEQGKGIPFKPGFSKLFAHSKQKGLKCALVTSSPLKKAKHHFAGTDYFSQFDVVVTAEDVKNGKPAPDCYLMACAQLDIGPANCLVLEDSNNGMRSGLEAGCQAIMIPDLLIPAAEVERRATSICTSLADVKFYL